MLVNPLSNLFESPYKLLGDHVREGMVVLEPGCGMGFFTLPLARLVGETGRVIAIDLQPKLMAVLAARSSAAGLSDRIEMRLGAADRLNIQDLGGTVDLALALYMAYETANPGRFFREVWRALKNEGRLLVMEPRGHITQREFEKTIAAAKEAGFVQNESRPDPKRRKALLQKVSAREVQGELNRTDWKHGDQASHPG
jgi:ubiquinone/menaquinone biosynthesis C-methylase UbiE